MRCIDIKRALNQTLAWINGINLIEAYRHQGDSFYSFNHPFFKVLKDTIVEKLCHFLVGIFEKYEICILH